MSIKWVIRICKFSAQKLKMQAFEGLHFVNKVYKKSIRL
jgi:hypothetical protein